MNDLSAEKPIRVVHITTIDMSLRYLLLNQLCYLARSGYVVIGVSSKGPNSTAIEAAGIRHLSVPLTRRLMNPLGDIFAIWRLYRFLCQGQVTIVHTHTAKAGVIGRLSARMARIPIIVHTIHGFLFHERSHWLWRSFVIAVEKMASRASDLTFSVSQEDVQTAIEYEICVPQKIKCLGNGGIGVDIVRFDSEGVSLESRKTTKVKIGIPDNAPVVGFVGRLVKEKGLLELMKAAAILRNKIPEVRFLIVGPVDTDMSDSLTPKVANQYNVSDICYFIGIRQDMPDLYAAMNVFTLPSHREGFPRAPMEASAMSVPCVVTDVRGCREAVEHGRNGLVVPRGDVQALADAIIELLSDQEKARHMGEEGRRMAEERFDERLVFQKVLAEYERLLREKGLPIPKAKFATETKS